MEIIYCIKHENEYELQIDGCSHVFSRRTEEHPFVEFEYCGFPLGVAYCPPPEDDLNFMSFEEWQEWVEVNEPSSNELLISNLQARELLADFEELL